MIKVNLLPHELRPFKRTILPQFLSVLVLAAALVFMGRVFLQQYAELSEVDGEIAQRESELTQLGDIINEHNELNEQKGRLQDKIVTIQSILADRTIWSEQFHRLTELTPDNIWYKQIRLTTRKFPEEQPVLDRRGVPEVDANTGKPKTRRVQVDRPVLEISGYAVDDASGVSNTAALATNTTTDPAFSAMFTLFTSVIIDTEYNGFPVREFKFEYIVS